MIIEAISVLFFFVIAYAIYSFILKKEKKKKYGIPKVIRKTYKKILAPTNKIVILSREYYEQEQPDELAAENTLYPLFDNFENTQSNLKYTSVLTYDDGKYSFKSIPIEMSSMELKEIFKKEETIAIYYNELDSSKYYFDLSKIIKS